MSDLFDAPASPDGPEGECDIGGCGPGGCAFPRPADQDDSPAPLLNPAKEAHLRNVMRAWSAKLRMMGAEPLDAAARDLLSLTEEGIP